MKRLSIIFLAAAFAALACARPDKPAIEIPEITPSPLPDRLEIEYSRIDTTDPVSAEEVSRFTGRVIEFLKSVKYYDYVLNTTHGVDASTGMKDWQFWYNEHFKKEGDLVTFYHPVNLNDGGHNLHIGFSRALGDAIGAYLISSDPIAALATTQMCKGFSASMLGMVYDENDEVHHLMTRNVAAFNHEYLTHDGKRKAVDYSGWFSEYTRWNCYRFAYENNPYWGKVWITNLRSKDDVPHIFRLIPNLRYAVDRAEDPELVEACGETLELLELFAKDIVDSDYRIRTKDENGNIFMPGYDDPHGMSDEQGDLASLTYYIGLIDTAECNARQGAEYIGYHEAIASDCGRGEPDLYDDTAYQINRYNKRIVRYFHLANLANALVNRDNETAAKLIDGLDERIEQEKAADEADMKFSPEDYYRNLALYLAQSHSFGFPLTGDEVRMIQYYYELAIDKMKDWPYWDPWADSVGDGEHGGYRPPNCEGPDEERVCWWRVEDLGQIFEACWSPFINPAGSSFVDCEMVRDPASWE